MLTDEQIEARRGRLTSSNVAKAFGFSPPSWGTPLDAWNDIMGRSRRDETTDMTMGHLLEPVVAAVFARETGHVLIPGDTVLFEEWAASTPDYLIHGTADALECKAVGEDLWAHWGPGKPDVPLYVETQVRWQMMCCNLERVHVWAFFTKSRIGRYLVERDAETEANLRLIGRRWFDAHVVGNVPPKPEMLGGEEHLRWLMAVHRENTGTFLECADDSVERMRFDDLLDFAAKRKEAERLELAAKTDLVAAVGDHAGLIFPDGSRFQRERASSMRYKDLAEAYRRAAIQAGADESTLPNIETFKTSGVKFAARPKGRRHEQLGSIAEN